MRHSKARVRRTQRITAVAAGVTALGVGLGTGQMAWADPAPEAPADGPDTSEATAPSNDQSFGSDESTTSTESNDEASAPTESGAPFDMAGFVVPTVPSVFSVPTHGPTGAPYTESSGSDAAAASEEQDAGTTPQSAPEQAPQQAPANRSGLVPGLGGGQQAPQASDAGTGAEGATSDEDSTSDDGATDEASADESGSDEGTDESGSDEGTSDEGAEAAPSSVRSDAPEVPAMAMLGGLLPA